MERKKFRKITVITICISLFAVLLIQAYLLYHTAIRSDEAAWRLAAGSLALSFINLLAVMVFASSYSYVGEIAYSDVSGVNNKMAYQERLKQLDEARYTYSIGIVTFDLNDLKAVNDNLGHKAGEEYIAAFSHVIAGMQRQGVSVYRIGGDEFSIILEHTNEIEIKKMLNSIADAVDGYNRYKKTKVSYAQGYAISTSDNYLLIDELVTKADRQMYADKKRKKGVVRDEAERETN